MKKSMSFEQLGAARKKLVRQTLRREFASFFKSMTAADETGWPAINDQELVDALADALIDMGETSGKGIALLQTLIHELQDRVDQRLR
ncbi:MAG: hypothetical protein KIT63_12900 [Rhodoferax sp.]|nr:hypothetical protein [Rhodoferax sp.]